MEINFRPHHFLCTLCFQGKGYSPAFIANYEKIVTQLNQDPATEINVIEHTDTICAPCPHRQGLLCNTQEKISGLDRAHSMAVNIRPGEVLSWAEAKQRIAEHLTLEKFHAICANCSWKSLGICQQVLGDYLATKPADTLNHTPQL